MSWATELGGLAIAVLRDRAASATAKAAEAVVIAIGRELGATLQRLPASVRKTSEGLTVLNDLVTLVARSMSLSTKLYSTLLHATTTEMIQRDLDGIASSTADTERILGKL